MLRNTLVIALIATVSACGSGSETAPVGDAAYDAGILGRWDVRVTSDQGAFPLWFELEGDPESGMVSGRLQGRYAHARPMESLEALDAHAMWQMGSNVYHANFEGGEIHGSVTTEDGTSLDWVAVRAPELPTRDPASVSWGEPIELFNGTDLSGWEPRSSDAPNQWAAEDGVLVNRESGSDLVTEASFSDFKLEVEVNVPEGSNSGIYLRGRYEVQVQDDHGKEPHARHMGGIYGQVTPTSNPALPAGEWQSFAITLLGRHVTVVLNGETIIDHQEIGGPTGGALDSNEAEPGPIFLQGDHGRVLYRNFVLTEAN